MFAGVFKKKSITLIMKRLRGSSLINPFFNEASSFVKRKRFMCKATDIRFWIENVKTNTIRSSRETVRYFCSFFFGLTKGLLLERQWSGELAQLVERIFCKDEAISSNLIFSKEILYRGTRSLASQVLQ